MGAQNPAGAGGAKSADQATATVTNNLWIAKFECDTKAAQAVAMAQQADLNALEYANLFAGVTSFATVPAAPAGAWTLNAKEIDFGGGSAAARTLVGWGAGRAHLVMEYTLHDATGAAVWTKQIKSQPSFWGASGATGAVQNQGDAERKQGQDLVNALAKFLQNRKPATGAGTP